MSVNKIDASQRYTLRDYLSWEIDERYELIDGVPYLMTSPSTWHQKIVLNFALTLGAYFRDHACDLYIAPMDLLLFGTEQDSDEKDIVQPDLFVMCKGSYGRMVSGVPEWVIEILSPSTARKDHVAKLRLYQKAEVKEYWIVDPLTQYVRVFVLCDGQYGESVVYERNEVIRVSVFDDLEVPLSEVFLDEIAATLE